ncbi:MAG: arginine kinase [Candidatus Niyogibacteria bacterium CG10_big_fil_rev_8_21_14_0_10_46_36]|uniref:Arginine kinase n=1 Tax=Candidatus Niyogibacteria bacterium CG10_big_fil_rev_8_21_14_0_10_46_36 TaxID=1974726 RepID=A0A2H0TEH7_9BACT|nr:MAG: arginine kinase [Candidatus Niyogibacteria bacterium CG10_big_fil_rev_8_21_14_0_10_46_36]
MTHQDILSALRGSSSLLAKHLEPELLDSLEGARTSRGFAIADVIRSGVENTDSGVGVYIPDEESLETFGPFLKKIITAYHGFGEGDSHRRDFAVAEDELKDLDPTGEFIISTRVRVGRNLKGYPFAPGITQEERKEVEQKIVSALGTLTDDLAGMYYPLAGMKEDIRAQLVADHFLFKQGDRFLESAGANRDWPDARGIFHSADKKFLVWVNEEDQLRIISMEQGGNLHSVYNRLVRAFTALEKKLDFAYSERYGFLSSCPTNLGTAMRASVHIKLAGLEKSGKLKEACDALKLSVRGIHGEHSESAGGVYDISNKQRLGISEADIIRVLANGVRNLIALEKSHLKK